MPRATRFTPRFSSSTTTGARAISVGSCGVRGRSAAYAAAPDSRARLLARSENENDRFRDAFPNARDAGDPEDATRRVLDAFVRVFGRTSKTGNDFRLCVRPYAARDIASGGIAEIVHPEKMGWREIKSRMEKRVSPLRVTRVRRAKKKKKRAADMTCRIPTRRDYSGERACTSTRRAGVLSEHCAPRRRRTSRFSTPRATPRGASSRAREALRARWDTQDDPNAPSDFRREAYPYVSFRGTTHANTRDARDGDARTFERLVKARSRRSEKVSREDHEMRRLSNV